MAPPKRLTPRRQQQGSGGVDWDLGLGQDGSGGGGSGLGDEELGGGPPTQGGDDAPIGVPEDYTVDVAEDSPVIARGEVPASTRPVGPRYYDGDEWEPARLSPEEVRAIQQAMWDAGLLEPGFRLGVWDETMASAYRQVLGYANATGISDQQALSVMAAAGPVDTEQTQPLITQTTNPDDLRRVFRASIISELGQGWDSERIDRMVAAYQQAEVAAQRSAYDLETTGEAGNIVAPPSPEAFAEAEVMRIDPTGVQAQDIVADYAPLFMQLAGSSAWGVSAGQ